MIRKVWIGSWVKSGDIDSTYHISAWETHVEEGAPCPIRE